MALNFEKLGAFVEKNRAKIIEAEKFIWDNPETGFKEWKTSKYLEEEFEKLGYKLKKAGNIPGFTADIDTGKPGPRILIFGELDSLICTDHPDAKENGAVHACGHNAQCAALLGIAASLKEEGALDGLCGSIRLCAVPAEELIEQEFREELVKNGIIKYYGGKVEFLYRGLLDDCDIAFMIHTTITADNKAFTLRSGGNGCFTKNISFLGVSSHAGGSPHLGVNALYAANLMMNAANALRETFRDNEHIRFHPIITYGGTATNAIPGIVKLESYVRGANIQAIKKENMKINRAIAGSAASMGANAVIDDRMGYMPYMMDVNLLDIAKEAMEKIVPEDRINNLREFSTGCSDIGDICSIMPTCHPYAAGASGKSHGADYFIKDAELACVNSSKAQFYMLHMLLSNNAERAKFVIANKKTVYNSKDEYFKEADSVNMTKKVVEYNDDGTITLNFNK